MLRIDFLAMHLEILKHDGPARLGKLHFADERIPTPSILWNSLAGPPPAEFLEIASPDRSTKKARTIISYGSIFSASPIEEFGILPSFPSGYNTPEDIVREAVKKTIEFSAEYPDFGAVVEGGRYLDLRAICAKEFKNRPLIKVADSHRLFKNHRKLVDIITMVRETASPNTALFMSNAPPHLFSILAYMGVDLFDITKAIIGAHKDLYLTTSGVFEKVGFEELPCHCKSCKSILPGELDTIGLRSHNINVTVASIKEVREAIRRGTLRNLVEERVTSDLYGMGALRILDAEKADFLERYTPLHPTFRQSKNDEIGRRFD
jgi:predicted RNA-binding protein